MIFKHRIVNAYIQGELSKEFCIMDVRRLFPLVAYTFITSFLPSATIEPGRTSASHTRFLFRRGKGQYRFHDDALEILTTPEDQP